MARQTRPRPILGHEVDGFGRDLLGGHGEVAFVLAVLVVDDDDHAAGANLLQRGFDVAEWGGNGHGAVEDCSKRQRLGTALRYSPFAVRYSLLAWLSLTLTGKLLREEVEEEPESRGEPQVRGTKNEERMSEERIAKSE